jgi:hypothetical protein
MLAVMVVVSPGSQDENMEDVNPLDVVEFSVGTVNSPPLGGL